MQEALLQFIWQYNLYRPGQLKTTEGLVIQVVHPGILNRDAGPDFSMAKVQIANALLIGNVELHIRTSDWLKHRHQDDTAYSRIILHVVFDHDMEQLPGGIPVLELGRHIPSDVVARYSNLIQTTAALPCATMLSEVPDIQKTSWLSRMLVERWEEKLQSWEQDLHQANGDWQTLFYWRLAANFGFKVNAAPFMLLAQSLPLKILLKQTGRFQVEALLFGQGGFLTGKFEDDYPRALQQEYVHLRAKYSLQEMDISLWKFLRMRPANFPTIRLSQFAALVHQSPQLFSTFSKEKISEKIPELSVLSASDYWENHYQFEHIQKEKKAKKLGSDSADNIIINTIAPLRFLYAHTHHNQDTAASALSLLEDIPSEKNNIIRLWEAHNWKPENAADSQSLIQLFNRYCNNKRCLECAIGLTIIKSRPNK